MTNEMDEGAVEMTTDGAGEDMPDANETEVMEGNGVSLGVEAGLTPGETADAAGETGLMPGETADVEAENEIMPGETTDVEAGTGLMPGEAADIEAETEMTAGEEMNGVSDTMGGPQVAMAVGAGESPIQLAGSWKLTLGINP